jgi:hypothetical protein
VLVVCPSNFKYSITDEETRSRLNVDEAVLAPAAALPGCQTLAVFVHMLPKVDAERSQVRQPPPRLTDLLAVIRPHENVPDTVRRFLKTLEQVGAEEIRRRRRNWQM